jgi:hypothetical protein
MLKDLGRAEEGKRGTSGGLYRLEERQMDRERYSKLAYVGDMQFGLQISRL